MNSDGQDRFMKSVFDWDHFHCYLAGAIDFAPDGGRDWRTEWTKKLIDLGFKPKQIFSPTKKPISNTRFDLDNEAQIMADLREKEDWDGLSQVVAEIAHIDLRLVDKSDLILVNFPKGSDGKQVPTYGTIHEIVNARKQRKPVLMVWEGGKKTCSGWLMWLVGHQNVFSTFEELADTLKKIANGEEAYNAKDWLLINYNKSYKERKSS